MNDTEGCLLYLVLGGVLFLCINVARDLNIRPIIMFLFILAFGLVCLGILLLHYTIDNKRNERIKTKANEIQDKYPRAYRRFLLEKGYYSKNESLRIDIYKEAVKRDIAIWEKEEAALKEEYDAIKKRELEQTAQFNELVNKYPHGIERLKKEQPNATSRELIQAEGTIKKYENDYLDYVRIKQWYDAQLEFSRTSRKAHIDGCGCVSFSVSLSGTGEQGEEKEYKHLIWQHFAASYCQDNTLDYTYKTSLWLNNRIVSSVESCSTRINKAVLESIFSFVRSLPKETGVLFADNPQEIPLDDYISFHYHSFIKLLNDNEIRHWRSDELGMISERDHIRNFVILDSISTCKRAEALACGVLEKLCSIKPCITVFSIFKELSSTEAKRRINDIKEQKFKEWSETQAGCYDNISELISSSFVRWQYRENVFGTSLKLRIPHVIIWPFSKDLSLDEFDLSPHSVPIPLLENEERRVDDSVMLEVFSFIQHCHNPIVVFADSGHEMYPAFNEYHFPVLRNCLNSESIPFHDMSDELHIMHTPRTFHCTIIVIELISSPKTVADNRNKAISLFSRASQDPLVYLSFWCEVPTEELVSLRINKQTKANEYPEIDLNEQHAIPLSVKTRVQKQNAQLFKEYLEENNVRYLFHFTDRQNVESIKKNGGLFSWKYCEEHNIQIKNAGGDETSRFLDTKHKLEDYVRLSFCTDHPMAWRLKQNGSNLVLLKIQADVAWLQGTLFSDINAADNAHHHGPSLDDLKRVDINATRMHYLTNTSEFFKKHQAEVLVKTHVPLEYIVNIDDPYII